MLQLIVDNAILIAIFTLFGLAAYVYGLGLYLLFTLLGMPAPAAALTAGGIGILCGMACAVYTCLSMARGS